MPGGRVYRRRFGQSGRTRAHAPASRAESKTIRPENFRCRATCPRAFRRSRRGATGTPPTPSFQISVGFEPADGVGNGLTRRSRCVTELARRLFRAEIHLFSRHPNPVERDEGVTPGNAGRQLRPDGDRKQHTVRDPEPGWATADRLRDLGEDLSQRHVLAPENISLTDPSLLGRGEMAFGDVIDMDDVEAGVDKSGHLSARRL